MFRVYLISSIVILDAVCRIAKNKMLQIVHKVSSDWIKEHPDRMDKEMKKLIDKDIGLREHEYGMLIHLIKFIWMLVCFILMLISFSF